MCNAATILMDDSLTNIDLIYDFAYALNASIEQQVPESALVKPLIAGNTTDFHFFFAKIRKRDRPFAHLNNSVLVSWPSGIEGCLDTRGWQFDSLRGVLLRATFCSGVLLTCAITC